jgi:hypothetical protein
MAQVVEQPYGRHEALSSNSSTAKKIFLIKKKNKGLGAWLK